MPDTEKISRFLKNDCPLSHEGLDELLASFQQTVIPKGTVILKNDRPDHKLRFMNSGAVREYYVKDQKEVNINFYTSPHFLTDFSSLISGEKTRKNQESLTEVELLEFNRKPFFELLEKYECRQEFKNMIFDQLLKGQELFEYNRITKSPEELYKELRIYKSEWLQEIPQYHIASFLGVTPETLSRIRSRIS